VPPRCARELSIGDGRRLCIRVLMHLRSERPRSELHHVSLEAAKGVRDDLPS